MSQPTQILNSIELWLQQNRASDLEQFGTRPILTPKQIEEKIAILPYKLPKEVIELYKWLHSGHELFLTMPDGNFDRQMFLNLDRAISLSIDWENSGVFTGMRTFPLITDVYDAIYWTVGSNNQQDVAPIYSNDEATFPSTPDAENLTAFLTHEFERLQSKRKIDE
ncbi:SMI1/KNR4 family protein [Aliterella atlantica]|uniref:Knr4/Smi1-like domain-containing protein n=1 Tax=Aliterella atlantica CENA595 TaxID=1618023 RepID=A0A0D8ZU63_9CYAN|nr:hypothetical protein [Aliterella atlantica]KJH71932.1 hypothetical protein UH38_09410 [Aliterella atlantica CENA595]